MAYYAGLRALNQVAARAAWRSGRIALHGAAVSVDGVGVMLVGHSGSGKTTLAVALAQAGHALVAEEVCAVDPELQIHPFLRPLGVRPDARSILGLAAAKPLQQSLPAPIRPSRLGPIVAVDARCRVGLIVLMDRNRFAVDGSPRRTSGAITRQPTTVERPPKALVELFDRVLITPVQRALAFNELDQLVRRVPVVSLSAADLSVSVGAVVDAALNAGLTGTDAS